MIFFFFHEIRINEDENDKMMYAYILIHLETCLIKLLLHSMFRKQNSNKVFMDYIIIVHDFDNDL